MSSQEKSRILVVEDDTGLGKVLVALLNQGGYMASHVSTAESALERLSQTHFDLVLSDIRLPKMDGMALLEKARLACPDLPVVLMTAHGNVPLAVSAMKQGAADFLLKPCDREDLLFVVRRVLASSRDDEGATNPNFDNLSISGESPSMLAVYALIRKVAPTASTVLIRGETGTGKELVAKAIHAASPKRSEPFVRIHCGALAETLLESELFGYEKGAFTGAVSRKPGKIELAHRGTLFLDEIGDISAATQVKLLRVLQEREFERVGGVQSIKVDVRVLTATHRNLEQMVADGKFREDLFYRLNVIPLHLPPLRNRPGDIDLLARNFCRQLQAQSDRPVQFTEGALSRLSSYPWPGNVRQLQNCVERLVVLSEGHFITDSDVQRELDPQGPCPPLLIQDSAEPGLKSLGKDHVEAEKKLILKALQKSDNNRSVTARMLGVSRRTLYNKLRSYGIE